MEVDREEGRAWPPEMDGSRLETEGGEDDLVGMELTDAEGR